MTTSATSARRRHHASTSPPHARTYPVSTPTDGSPAPLAAADNADGE
ncbi:hypothetical protein KGQ20_16755 [Catenulispora sp. NF23]|uniref:Uncharacterized protein n=1 Tax=Catenulispora pinistramenti TaxID=2705254 RepID=A0ABS5KWD7_9ACTN|nr:hypothetical protein [Catenulispora pinistramenti]MBS2534423.1 hypothetical protein [Catenulispora pinistramenti]MBS2550358.1 hypothetical protein [Catenulispora pinistramenti]